MIFKQIVFKGITLAGITIAISTATPANALTFNWSFVTRNGSTGGAGQTVQGTISGLVEGINRGPGLTVTVDFTPTGELTGGGWIFIDTDNAPTTGSSAFTVIGGAVVSANALFSRNNGNGIENLYFGGFGGYDPQLVDTMDSNPNWFTLSPNTFTPVRAASVPEPANALALLGLGSLGAVCRKLKPNFEKAER